MKKVYLTGYENEDIKDFLQKLKNSHITTLIDIREKPLSRKAGFSKNQLRELLEKENIKYFHMKELGSPSLMRSKLRGSGDYLPFFKAYRTYLTQNNQVIEDLTNIIYANGNSALMCYERNSDLCHRSIVANELIKTDQNFKIIPL